MLAQIRQVAKKTYTPHSMEVYIEGSDLVAIKVHIQTDAAAHGPDMDRIDAGKISEEMIQGRPFAPNDQAAPKIMIMAVAALPPATVDSDMGSPTVGFPRAMYMAR